MNYCALRVEEGDKDCEATSHKLASVTSNLDVFDHQKSRSKSWISDV